MRTGTLLTRQCQHHASVVSCARKPATSTPTMMCRRCNIRSETQRYISCKITTHRTGLRKLWRRYLRMCNLFGWRVCDEHGRKCINPWRSVRGGNQLSLPRFPPYSTDLNWAIKNVWRYMAFKVNDMADQGRIINSATMRETILRLWNDLPYEQEEGFAGINYYVEHWPDVLREVITQGGYDTRFMK